VQIRVLDRLDIDQATFHQPTRRQELPLRELVLETITQFGNFLRKNASILRAFMELGAGDPVAGELGKRHYNQALHDFRLLFARTTRPRFGTPSGSRSRGLLQRVLRFPRSLPRARHLGKRIGAGKLDQLLEDVEPDGTFFPAR
jgi:hypothetical protein